MEKRAVLACFAAILAASAFYGCLGGETAPSADANASRAEKALKRSPLTMPSALKEFKIPRLEKFAAEYEALDLFSRRLGIKGAELVPDKMSEAIRLTEQISKGNDPPQESVTLAMKCVEHLKAVAHILSTVKELDKSE